ncbi:MAG: alanine dehydrogenase [Acetobacteraceae bacterium]|nr:alanine dehydrogenase [Acetobacteraceae bacterium]
MKIAVPKEIKEGENRVAITPAGVLELVQRGHQVAVEASAGLGSGFSDEDFRAQGAVIVEGHEAIFAAGEMILKVKEPLPPEYPLLGPGQLLFTYLHLAAEPELTRQLMERRVTAVAYETVQLSSGVLPLLTPMSEIAGKMATQVGAHFLEKPYGGRGVLLGGVPGVPPADVVIIGGGTVGTNAARVALGMGARVTVLDVNLDRLRYLDELFEGQVVTLASSPLAIADAVRRADLLIGAVLIPGAKAPCLVTEDMVKTMKPGSVIVDVAIDQGGSVATVDRVTTHAEPTYVKHGVVHYSVANMPGAVPRTSTLALSAATLPYVRALAQNGFRRAIASDPALALGVNTVGGKITYRAVAEAHGLPYTPLEEALA